MESLESFPSPELVIKTRQVFIDADPLYRLPEEIGDTNYYAYQVDDAAYDVLIEDGTELRDPLFIYKKNALSRAARQEQNIKLVEKMRFTTQHLLNEGLGRPDIDPKG